LLAPLAVALAIAGAGCMAPQARETVLTAASQAIQTNMQADAELEDALARHSQEQQRSLTLSFLADCQRLAEQNGGMVSFGDLAQGMQYYQHALDEILQSRDNVARLFRAKRRCHEAALELTLRARHLTAGEAQQLEELERVVAGLGSALDDVLPREGGVAPASGDHAREGEP